MDAQSTEFARAFTGFINAMRESADEDRSELTEAGQHVTTFLGRDLADVEPTTETFPAHQVIDVDVALESLLVEHGGERHGIAGSNRAHVDAFVDYLTNHNGWSFGLGPVSYRRQPTGPDSDRRVVAFGMGQVVLDCTPLVWLQRIADRRFGRDQYTFEVLCGDIAVAERFLTRLRQRMSELSTMRGQVISFAVDDFDYHAPGEGLRYLRRPQVGADEVILPAGVLARITRHVVGIGQHSAALRAADQHLKRGVLLYGPPGTGKTHLIRHLLTATPGTTAVLLSGRTLGMLNAATTLARAAQPAIVVLEDCDLVAEQRGGDSGGALFEMLEAMDGLAPDADITFVLTTNRVDLLERALVERPGRVDLAVEIAKPDLEGRRRLFELYAADLLAAGHLTSESAEQAAVRTAGMTASFTKELIRRCVIDAAQDDRDPTDADVSRALDEMLSDAEQLTRTLLGGDPGPDLAILGGPDDPPADWV